MRRASILFHCYSCRKHAARSATIYFAFIHTVQKLSQKYKKLQENAIDLTELYKQLSYLYISISC